LRVSENRILRIIFAPLRVRKWQEGGEDCVMECFVTYTLYQVLLE